MADNVQAPALAAFKGETAILELPDSLYDEVTPAQFPQSVLRWRNDRAAHQIGLANLDDARWIAHFARFEPLPGSLATPLALRYHGHQFRTYNPDIGDGRGFLYAQMRDGAGRLMDFGTKGSGRTPWSRFGDGRLTLKGAVREILATEMLEALGVETSRSLSVIETGEALERGDEPSPTRSAVLVRLSHGHIRIGTFQRLAYLRDSETMQAVVAYVLRHFYGEDAGDDAPARLLDHVVARTARLAASYMAAGFVHGVLNTDNINVTGESFDYGPWRFTPRWDPAFTAAYFDHGGLYAFGRQPEAMHWNCMQLAVALRTVSEAPPLIEVLDRFAERYQAEVTQALLWRLGVIPLGGEQDRGVIEAIERGLGTTAMPIDRFFHEAFGGSAPAGFDDLRALLAAYRPRRARDHAHWNGPVCGMAIDEVEAIWSPIAERDDWAPFHAKIAAVRALGEALGPRTEPAGIA
ncbi:protein adenylyltransferase SelO family protein [Sphingomonas baiyangensis]|uniref:Protein nucleotidyltransferase YdiU n=1 Tax=Sphingomonas baiyangensis TaxID=2572576 RepID=A0A4U1L121_9SPHN|nr:YdiU family protein [Sphingomonas baiyangensis]TKD50469.1 YdiU family protein [Sphingomonas baiyangensis]